MTEKPFKEFPKVRHVLPEEYKKIYVEHYFRNREGGSFISSLTRRMEQWLHRKVAYGSTTDKCTTILEIGAGTLNHLNYEKSNSYDIIEPMDALYSSSNHVKNIRNIFKDIREVSEANKYDKIIAIAVFEHITDLPAVVAKTCLHLSDSGTLRISIPNEGSLLWKTGWKLSSGIDFKLRYGLDYGVLMSYEHVNTADEIEDIIKYFYKSVKLSVYGLSRKIALYRYYECSGPRLELAKEFMKECT